MNENLLKKIEEFVDKRNKDFRIEMLIEFVINKLNNYSIHDDNTLFEGVLLKLIQSGFSTLIKTYCYYLISDFNHELSPSFFSAINNEIDTDSVSFEKYDLNFMSLRNYMNLNEKEIIDNYNHLEQIFKNPKHDINMIINSFYYTNVPVLLLESFDKLNIDEYRSFKEFLKKFYLDLGKLLFLTRIEEGSFLNLLKILDRIIVKFNCISNISTKDRVINSIIIFLAEFLMNELDGLIEMIIQFDIKLLLEVITFPINLYKIYNFYRDPNNPDKSYEQSFHKYISYLFECNRQIIDPEIFSYYNRAITEFKILDNFYNPYAYSTETLELVSKFLEFNDTHEKNSWYDINLKLISKNIENLDYEESLDIIIMLLSETKYINNLCDRIFILFNLFYRLIMINVNYSNYFEKESLILCLFKQDWFVFLINKDKPDQRESRFRHDLFITMIETLFYAKTYILKNGFIKKIINLIKICLDIIDVCFKIIEWSDEGEAYKMYFLVLEESCLFFDDPFYCFLFGQDPEFVNMKSRLEQVLVEISKRFSNKQWNLLAFANENSKYRSLLLLSQFLIINNNQSIHLLLDVIFLRINEINLDKKNEKFVEQILKSCLFLGIRVNTIIREKIITNLIEFFTKAKKKMMSDFGISNIISFTENILNYLVEHKSDHQIILDYKTVDRLNNEFYLIIPKDIESNHLKKTFNLNNLYLLNIAINSHLTIDDFYNMNSSLYLDSFKRLYYYPMLEYNNDYSFILIDNQFSYKISDWILVTGSSDPIHIYYMTKMNLETKQVELSVKSFNICAYPVNNIIYRVYFSKNIVLLNNSNTTNTSNTKEFNLEILSPNSAYEFSFKYSIKNFDKNNIFVECCYDINSENIGNFILSSEPFYSPLTDFFIPDNFALYDNKKFDIFYSTLDYTFTVKCYANCTPDELLKCMNKRFLMVEYKSKNSNIDESKKIIDKLKETSYKEFFTSGNHEEGFGNIEDNQRFNFKIKISSFCVFNFWLYFTISGDYTFSNNKSILNIELKSNNLSALQIINNNKSIFLNELFYKKIKFY